MQHSMKIRNTAEEANLKMAKPVLEATPLSPNLCLMILAVHHLPGDTFL